MSVLIELQDRVLTELKVALPKLITCERHPGRFSAEELKTFSAKAPAVLVAMPSLKDAHLVDGDVRLEAKTVIILIAKNTVKGDKALSADEAVALMVTNTLLSVAAMSFGDSAQDATDINADNLYGASNRKDGVAMWAVHFTNEMTLTGETESFEGLKEIYLGFDPATGPDHVEDYIRIGGEDA